MSDLSTRAYWLSVLTRVGEPVLTAASRGELKKKMPIESRAPRDDRAKYTHLEAVARLLTGIAPWLELEETGSDTEESKLRAKYRRLALGAIDKITDPESPDHCNFSVGGQPVVDAAFLAQALLRAPKQLWAALPKCCQKNVIASLQATRVIKPNESNWLLFSAIIEAVLAKFGGEGAWKREPIDYALKRHESWYKGDGAYGDGAEFHWDYYNSFVIQPMLLDVLDAVGDRGPWVDEKFPERVRARARRYAAVQERLISPEGTLPPIGRSLAYRFGTLQLLGQIALRHDLPPELNPAQVRCGMTAVIRRLIEAPNTFDAEGWLRVGFFGSQPSIGETYISTGSTYLCAAGLLPLALPASDPFWSAPDADWTSRKVYAGVDVPTDHALTAPK